MQLTSILITLLMGLTLSGVAAPATAEQAPRFISTDTARVVEPRISNFVLVSQQASGWRRYAPGKTCLFKAGEALQFYAEPVNLGWSQRGQGFRFEMRIDVDIRSPEGKIVWGQKDFGKLNGESPAPNPDTYITGSVKVDGLAPGFYVLTLRLRDPSNNRVVETETAFGIMPEPRQIDA